MKSIKDGSFFFPLFGTGAKKGLSVSIKILFNGSDLKVSCKSIAFLKVIIPLAEKNEFKVNNFLENYLEPVKQCIKILTFWFL